MTKYKGFRPILINIPFVTVAILRKLDCIWSAIILGGAGDTTANDCRVAERWFVASRRVGQALPARLTASPLSFYQCRQWGGFLHYVLVGRGYAARFFSGGQSPPPLSPLSSAIATSPALLRPSA